jgi:hypothetical protein
LSRTPPANRPGLHCCTRKVMMCRPLCGFNIRVGLSAKKRHRSSSCDGGQVRLIRQKKVHLPHGLGICNSNALLERERSMSTAGSFLLGLQGSAVSTESHYNRPLGGRIVTTYIRVHFGLRYN